MKQNLFPCRQVCELARVNVSEDPTKPDFQISTNIILDQVQVAPGCLRHL
jgi:hypothetical protein